MLNIGNFRATGQLSAGNNNILLSATTIPVVNINCNDGTNIVIDSSAILNTNFDIELSNVVAGARYIITILQSPKNITGLTNTVLGDDVFPIDITNKDISVCFLGLDNNELRYQYITQTSFSIDEKTIINDSNIYKVGTIDYDNVDPLTQSISYKNASTTGIPYAIDVVNITGDFEGEITTNGGIDSSLVVGNKIISQATGFSGIVTAINGNTVSYKFGSVIPRRLDSYIIINDIFSINNNNISSFGDIIEEESRGAVYIATRDCDTSGNLIISFNDKRKARIILDRNITNLSFDTPTYNIKNILEVYQTGKYKITYDSSVDFSPRSTPRHENTPKGVYDYVEVRLIVDSDLSTVYTVGDGIYGNLEFTEIQTAGIASSDFNEPYSTMSFLSTSFVISLYSLTINAALHGSIVAGSNEYVIYDSDKTIVLVKTDLNGWCVIDNNDDSLLYKQVEVTDHIYPSDVVSWEDNNNNVIAIDCIETTILDDNERRAYQCTTDPNIKIWRKYGKGYILSNTNATTEWLYEDSSSGYVVEDVTDAYVWRNAGANTAGNESTVIEDILIYSSSRLKIAAECEYSKRVI